MKKILQSTLIRVTCQVLAFAMLATLIPQGLTTKAYAQSGSALGSQPARRVGVIEFINDSNKFGQIVTKNATSAFVMECNKSSRAFKIEASIEEVKAKMDEMGIRQPSTKVDAVNLATELDLDGMIEGFIKSIDVKGSGSNKTATATIVVQYIDRRSGEVIVGTTAKGESSARIGFTADEDTLVTEAINKAVQAAVFNLGNYSVPRATVHANEGEDRVILNAGTRNNLYPGLRMVVLRGAYPENDPNLEDSTIVTDMKVVGYIEIMQASAIDSVAKIIKHNVGVKPEDVCFGLYNGVYVSKYNPNDDTFTNVNNKNATAVAKKKAAASSIGLTILAVAAAVGLVSLFSSSGDNASGPNVGTGSTPGDLIIKKNSNGYITGKIIGLRVYRGTDYIDLLNNATTPTYYGAYDGRSDVPLNVYSSTLWSTTPSDIQYAYSAKWIYNDGDGNLYSDASGSAKWTRLSAATNLEPSSSIDSNSFETGSAFIWDCDSYDGDKVTIKYKVEVWDASNGANKKIFYTNNKYLGLSDLTTLYNFFKSVGIDNKTFAWRVGVQNSQDSNTSAYNWSSNTTFTVDSLPPAPPTKGTKR